MTPTLKERLELVKRPCPKEPKEAVYSGWVEYENQCNDADKFNAGVDACLPLLEEVRKEGAEEYKQFILNILDGVDIADGECNTKAIRFTINSRTI